MAFTPFDIATFTGKEGDSSTSSNGDVLSQLFTFLKHKPDMLNQFRDILGVSSNAGNVVNNFDLSSVAAAIGQLASSGAGAQLAATRETNALNKEMWLQGEANTDRRLQQQMDFSHQEAQNAMDYQTEMSNTAHQREVRDLIAAGLNPVLSASGQGASTPSGLMGGVSAASGNGFSAAQPSVVGAYTAAGSLLANMMSLEQQMKIFNKEFEWRDKNKWLSMFNSMVGTLSSALVKQ